MYSSKLSQHSTVKVNFIRQNETQIAILSPTEAATDTFPTLGPVLLDVFKAQFGIQKVRAAFCLYSSGAEMNLGRAERDKISKAQF